jgi:UDP-glucose:(heptosyl)LPS alpha-1,3-glucosyltransferase
MTKKVAIIIERARVELGGAERSIFELAEALREIGLKVDIIAASGNTDSESVHILCQDSPGKRVSYFIFANALKRYLSENHYDLIHSVLPFEFADVYQPRGGTYAESIFRNAASYQNKFLESYKRITALVNFRRTMLLCAERKLCKGSDGPVIVAISQYVAEQFKRHYGVAGKRIVVVPNGVKIDKEVDDVEARKLRSQIFQKHGLSESDKPVLFLFAANNFRLKGLSVLIKALFFYNEKAFRNNTQRACLIVAGGGKTQKYRKLAKRLNASKSDGQIVFLGPIELIQNALTIVDVAVLPTFYDPCSRYILEALAAEKPVITTSFNGASEQFVDNRHGKIIDTPGDIPTLVEAIDYFTDTNNIRKASEAIATDNLKEKVSVKRAANQLLSVYESILQKKG